MKFTQSLFKPNKDNKEQSITLLSMAYKHGSDNNVLVAKLELDIQDHKGFVVYTYTMNAGFKWHMMPTKNKDGYQLELPQQIDNQIQGFLASNQHAMNTFELEALKELPIKLKVS